MSQRPQIKPKQVIASGDMSGNLTSLVTILDQISMCSYSMSWSGSTPVGTAEVQASNDYALYPDGSVKNSGTWTTLTLSVSGSTSNTIAITGNTGTAMIDIDQLGAYAVRLVYTRASGTGTFQAYFNGKVA